MKITSKSNIGYTPLYMTLNDKPWFPVMGEIHYSRVPEDNWEMELYKMKAGGVDIVSCYAIWIHHEEIQDEFDFSGQRNLRKFLETAKKCDMNILLRVGPWVHGEVRNGGFPDWLMKKSEDEGFELRSNDEKYLDYVKSYFTEIAAHTQGYLVSDDGPVIGMQIENEYGHVGGFTGEKGEEHMRTLQKMVMDMGLRVPLYTATGWGGAVTGGMLPVMGGYCEAPWDPRTTEIEPSGNYVFTPERNDHNIGSDHGFCDGITFDIGKFPYLTAELGGGLQVTKHRRPVATGSDIGAMSLAKLGSGCNLLGYYMYHGGINPDGKLTTLQESKETGYPNDLPVKSYDFNAPIKEYGQLSQTFYEIRLLASFVHDFEDVLCRATYTEQPGNTDKADDLTSLRTSVRCMDDEFEGKKIKSGFLFVNNYQRRFDMAEHKDVTLKAHGADGKEIVSFPLKRDIKNRDFFFYPFNMKIGNGLLRTAMVTPLFILKGAGDNGKDCYVFYSDSEVGVNYGRSQEALRELYEFEKLPDDGTKICTITRMQALYTSKIDIDGIEHLIMADGVVLDEGDGNHSIMFGAQSDVRPVFALWPASDKVLVNFSKTKTSNYSGGLFVDENCFSVYESVKQYFNCMLVSLAKDKEDENKYKISVFDISKDAVDAFILIDYEGESALLKNDRNKLVADSFYTGQLWEIGLGKLCNEEGEMKGEITINPLHEKDKIYLQNWPEMTDGAACRINGIKTETIFSLDIM